MNERCPHTRYHPTQLLIRLRDSLKWLPVVVALSCDVVEYECHFFEVHRALDIIRVAAAHVEAVAVCWRGGLGPDFALAAAVGVHGVVAGVGVCASPLEALGWDPGIA